MLIATNSSKLDISLELSTKKIAKNLSKILKLNDIVLLYGEIGVGKTTFVQTLINNLQKINKLKLTEVTSPTFSIVNEYEIADLNIQHYDLHRLKNVQELKNLGLFENRSKFIKIIEWPQILNNKPAGSIDLYFEYNKDLSKRFLTIEGLSKKNYDKIKI